MNTVTEKKPRLTTSAMIASIASEGQRVNGNDLGAVLGAFDRARAVGERKPRVILFDTLMGKGVPFLESREKNHFIRVDPPEWQQALQILDQSQPYMQPEGAPA